MRLQRQIWLHAGVVDDLVTSEVVVWCRAAAILQGRVVGRDDVTEAFVGGGVVVGGQVGGGMPPRRALGVYSCWAGGAEAVDVVVHFAACLEGADHVPRLVEQRHHQHEQQRQEGPGFSHVNLQKRVFGWRV